MDKVRGLFRRNPSDAPEMVHVRLNGVVVAHAKRKDLKIVEGNVSLSLRGDKGKRKYMLSTER